jgi:excinuclease UvrABC nuclease subunit
MHSYIAELEYEMELAARNLQFEQAALLRDKIAGLKTKQQVRKKG